MKVNLSPSPRAEPWALLIRTALGKSVEAVIDIGSVLSQAKAALPHGEWSRLFEDHLVPFSIGTAQRLMAVADHPLLSKAAHAPCLPASWTSLYELTKVDVGDLAAALKDGRVTPAMQRSDVTALIGVQTDVRQVPVRSDLKTEHCDVRVPRVLLRVLEFTADRLGQTVADFVRLGLWSVIHESLSEAQVAAVIKEATAHPQVTNRSLERLVGGVS